MEEIDFSQKLQGQKQGIWIDISIYYLTPTNFSNKRTPEEETFDL